MGEEQKKCVVLYKSSTMEGLSPYIYGHCFDELQPCCEAFKRHFFSSGNPKETNWNRSDLCNSKPGLNFLSWGDKFQVYLFNEVIHFCPWCGASIEVKHSRSVKLRHKVKTVPDGFEEIS